MSKLVKSVLCLVFIFLSLFLNACNSDIVDPNDDRDLQEDVIVNGNHAPMLYGESTIYISLGDSINLNPSTLFIGASDVEDGDLTSEISWSGVVNTSREGTYTITYSVTDSGGLKDDLMINIIVSDTTISISRYNLNSYINISVTDSITGGRILVYSVTVTLKSGYKTASTITIGGTITQSVHTDPYGNLVSVSVPFIIIINSEKSTSSSTFEYTLNNIIRTPILNNPSYSISTASGSIK